MSRPLTSSAKKITNFKIQDGGSRNIEHEGLSVDSIARDYPSPLPDMHRDRNVPGCIVRGKLDRNLKPKLAIMCQCTSVTDRRILTSYHKQKRCVYLALKKSKNGNISTTDWPILTKIWHNGATRPSQPLQLVKFRDFKNPTWRRRPF